MATFSVRFLGCKVSHVDVHWIRERLLADGVDIAGWWAGPGCVSVKFRDPGGSVVAVSWEPE